MQPGTVGTDTTIYESVETIFSSSARLNTELGFVIESPEIAAAMVYIFNEKVP